jgi:NADPH-dependent curcumin reductase CurA
MSMPSQADVIVLHRRPRPALLPGDLVLERYIVSDYYPQRLYPIRAELGALLRAKRLRAVVSEFKGLERAPEALATVFDRGSPYIGRRVVRISEG